MRIRFLPLVLVLVPGAARSQAARIHPIAEFVAKAPVTVDVSFGGAVSGLPFTRSSVPSAVIGTLDGPAPTIFSRILSAEFVDDTTIAVLDREAREVRLFSTRGRHIQTFGRKGSGPGEFGNLGVTTATPAGEILVTDVRLPMQAFRRGPRGFEYARSIKLPSAIKSLCHLGNRLFVSAPTFGASDKIIREIDDSGKVTVAFGEIYSSQNRIVNHEVAQGRIACDPARTLIYFMPGSLLGEVRAFRPTGELVWRVRVTDFLNNRVIDDGSGVTVERSPKGAHGPGALTITDKGVIAQWTFLSFAQMNAKEPPTSVHSVLVDPATGKAVVLGTQLPLIVARRGDLMVEQTEDPFPQLTVRRYAPSPRR